MARYQSMGGPGVSFVASKLEAEMERGMSHGDQSDCASGGATANHVTVQLGGRDPREGEWETGSDPVAVLGGYLIKSLCC